MRMRCALLAGALVLAAGGCGPDDLHVQAAVGRGEPVESAHVDGVRCGSDARGAVASGTLQNTSDDVHAYEIVVEWRNRAGEFYTGESVRTADLPPLATFSWEAVPDVPEAVRGTCEVVDVVELVPGGEATAFPTDNGAPPSTYPVPPDGN